VDFVDAATGKIPNNGAFRVEEESGEGLSVFSAPNVLVGEVSPVLFPVKLGKFGTTGLTEPAHSSGLTTKPLKSFG
jgi:hypothetical protein